MNSAENFEEIMSKANIVEVLEHNSEKNCLTLLGKAEGGFFILNIQKLFYDVKSLDEWTSLVRIIRNVNVIHDTDVYKKYTTDDVISNKNSLLFIYPASEKVIEKYRAKKSLIIRESYDDYLNKTLKYISGISESDTDWIRMLLYKQEETKERVLHIEPEEFKIVQDFKFSGTDKAYCLAVVFDASIKSLRDLNNTHLPLLEKILETGRNVVSKYFNKRPSDIRAFVHYPPQFFHFHVHLIDISIDVESSTTIYRSFDLYSIIQNIKIMKDYYQTIGIEYSAQMGSNLVKFYQ